MKDIPLKAHVQCSDGACGKSRNVIINPVTHKLTHLVVQDKKLPDNATRMVPIDQVASATQSQITLSCSKGDVADMQPFIVTHYVQETGSGTAYLSGGAYTSQYVINDTGYDSFPEERLPQGELAVYPGMEVDASDGKVGKLDELVLDPKSGDITHLQMREGHLWGKRDVAIPISAVDEIDANTIYLKLDKKALEALPAVKVKRKGN